MSKQKLNIFDLSKLDVANEIIDFQDGKFGKAIEDFFTTYLKDNLNEKMLVNSGQAEILSKIVKDYTGLKLKIDLSSKYSYMGPCIVLPTISPSHLFTKNNLSKDDTDKALNLVLEATEKHKTINGVNLKTSRVFGVFEEIEATYHLPYGFVKNYKMTAEEITAISLHEIGHLFTYFEYFDRTATTNQILSSLSVALTNQPVEKERKDLIDKVANAMNIKLGETEKLSLNKDPSATIIAIIGKVNCDDPSQLGTPSYDLTSCESQADAFVTRHQYGKHLGIALDKFGISYRANTELKRKLQYYSGLMSVIFRDVGLFVGIVTGTIALGTLLFSCALIMLGLYFQQTKRQDHTYDVPLVRYKRIREQLIHSIKNPNIDKKDLEQTKIGIIEMDKLISVTVNDQEFLEKISNYIFSKKSSEEFRIMQLQRDLEELSANDIFLASAKLRLLHKPS